MHNRQLDDRHMERFEDEVNLLAEERGISFSHALALKTGEAPRPAKKLPMTQAHLEELREGMRELEEKNIHNLEMMCGQQFTQMCEDGTIERRAREKGIPYQDAFRELQEEVYAPLSEAQLKKSGRGISSSPVMTEAEERAEQGFTNKEVEWRARSRGVTYGEAFNQLADERAAEDAVTLEDRGGPPVELLNDGAERRLDQKAQAYAERHGCPYPVALEAVLEEEDA